MEFGRRGEHKNDAQRITELVDKVEECWRRLRMEPSVRRRLVAELEAELAAARAAGSPVDDLVPSDVVRFAIERARAREAALHHGASGRSRGRVAATVCAGGAGVSLGWIVLGDGEGGDALLYRLLLVGMLMLLALPVVLGIYALTVALTVRPGQLGRSLRSALATTALAVTGGSLGLVLAIGYGRWTGYHSDSRSMLVEMVLVALGMAVGIAVGTTSVSPPGRSRP